MGLFVLMVEPRYEGNVGAVARLVRNFGADGLRLVRPCPLGEEARKRAMHGIDVLEAAGTYDRFEDAVASADLVVGSSGIETTGEKRFVRIAVGPGEMADRVRSCAGEVVLALGREDFGLRNEELERCDILARIPADDAYPILNVAHAAAILLYEIHRPGTVPPARRLASPEEREKLFESFGDLLEVTNYPAHKRDRTTVMFRRVLGRAVPTKWEFHALMGVIARAAKTIRRERARRSPVTERRHPQSRRTR